MNGYGHIAVALLCGLLFVNHSDIECTWSASIVSQVESDAPYQLFNEKTNCTRVYNQFESFITEDGWINLVTPRYTVFFQVGPEDINTWATYEMLSHYARTRNGTVAVPVWIELNEEI